MPYANDMASEIIRSRDHDIAQLQIALSEARAEIERLRAVVDAARKMPRWTPKGGGAATKHTFQIQAADVWALDAALKTLDDEQSKDPT